MRGMLLAAGRGKRLTPITKTTPKPLVHIDGHSLIERQIDAFAKAGIRQICINLWWLGEQIYSYLAQRTLPCSIHWQWENPLLDTGGGVAHALHWLCEDQPEFVLANADLLHDFPLARLARCGPSTLVLTRCRSQHARQQGDFALQQGKVCHSSRPDMIYCGIGRLHKDLFSDCPPGAFPLFAQLRKAIDAGQLAGLEHQGTWNDLGTPACLERYNWSTPSLTYPLHD